MRFGTFLDYIYTLKLIIEYIQGTLKLYREQMEKIWKKNHKFRKTNDPPSRSFQLQRITIHVSMENKLKES